MKQVLVTDCGRGKSKKWSAEDLGVLQVFSVSGANRGHSVFRARTAPDMLRKLPERESIFGQLIKFFQK